MASCFFGGLSDANGTKVPLTCSDWKALIRRFLMPVLLLFMVLKGFSHIPMNEVRWSSEDPPNSFILSFLMKIIMIVVDHPHDGKVLMIPLWWWPCDAEFLTLFIICICTYFQKKSYILYFVCSISQLSHRHKHTYIVFKKAFKKLRTKYILHICLSCIFAFLHFYYYKKFINDTMFFL